MESVADVGSRAVGASTKAVYTVPSNSTLMGSIAMTALIGRVPIDGTVNDPYPFKVLIGPDNLTANGIDIPDVAGAVVSGTASGDWTLSCVRGHHMSREAAAITNANPAMLRLRRPSKPARDKTTVTPNVAHTAFR